MSRSMMPTASRSCVGTICTAVSGKPCLAKRARETRVNRGARARAFGAAAQDRRVAALQAQRGRVGRDVRPALVNDADDAERHAHARDLEAVRPLPFGDRLARRDRRAPRPSRARRPSLRCACRRARGDRPSRPTAPRAFASATSSALAASTAARALRSSRAAVSSTLRLTADGVCASTAGSGARRAAELEHALAQAVAQHCAWRCS